MVFRHKNLLQVFPIVSLTVFVLPVLVGLLGTWLPAFGYLPVIGAESFSLSPFSTFFSHPATYGAFRATLVSGFGAPILALLITLWLVITVYDSKLWYLLKKLLSPLLAIPHASFAIGFAFLAAPSGFVLRLVSPELTGFSSPPDLALVKDPYGFSLTAVLILKEIPFLLLMSIGALNQLDIRRIRWIGGSLGYSNFMIWSRLIIPQIYPQLRLPLLAVLAYSLSVVDVSMIIGPTVPPTLAVLLNRWFNDPDIAIRLTGAAGATILFLLVVFTIAFTFILEKMIAFFAAENRINGKRHSLLDRFHFTGPAAIWLVLLINLLSIAVLILWSFTRSWRFPDPLPSVWSTQYWLKGLHQALPSLLNTSIIGLGATLVATVLVIGCLENEVRLAQKKQKSRIYKMIWILYLPLLVPQISFLFGVQTMVVLFHLDGKLPSVIGSHLIFVLPYVFLTMSEIYRRYDQRYIQVAVTLGKSPMRSFLSIKLPMLLKPIGFSMATGLGVSVVQYLPTLFVGAGRIPTITTETVSLASGADRRIIGVYALLQLSLPLLAYLLSFTLPALLFRKRLAMQN